MVAPLRETYRRDPRGEVGEIRKGRGDKGIPSYVNAFK